MSSGQALNSSQATSTMRKYIIGFALSILLTLIPFAIVSFNSFPLHIIVLILVSAMFAQVWVQLAFFLHMHDDHEHRTYLLSFWYTFLMIAIFFVGSVWVMYHLHLNMM